MPTENQDSATVIGREVGFRESPGVPATETATETRRELLGDLADDFAERKKHASKINGLAKDVCDSLGQFFQYGSVAIRITAIANFFESRIRPDQRIHPFQIGIFCRCFLRGSHEERK